MDGKIDTLNVRASRMPSVHLREYAPSDALAVNALAVAAFEQFMTAYTDWPAFRAKIESMSNLAATGEIVVAELDEKLVGAVVYVGPHQPKSEFFAPEWPIMRMLVVAPESRGHGVGRALAEECILRARRDGAADFALHTSKIMSVALPMYQRMGFNWWADAPSIYGVRYGVYIKRLDA